MRLLTYCHQGEVRFGAAIGSEVVDLSGRMPRCTSLKSLLAVGALAEAQDIVNGADADCALSDIRWLPPVPDAEKIICIGVNYGDRNAEYGDAVPAPAYPSVFMRSRESLTGHLEPLVRPPESTQLDYEGEIALVIGREGRRIPESSAREHIAGLTLVNEGSIRDWLRHSRFNVTPGKNFERSGAAGPWLVTKGALPNFDDLHLTTKVNGELRQDDHTGNLFFSFERLVSYLSTFMRLKPGDLIATGTPTGAGARLDPPQYLVPGDMVEVEVPEIGLLRNGVCDERLAP